MSITPYLKGPYYFDLETRRVLGVALELVCLVLPTGDYDEHVRQAIANKLIALAKDGERNPEVLCDRALEEICKPQGAAVSSSVFTPRLRGEGLVQNSKRVEPAAAAAAAWQRQQVNRVRRGQAPNG